MENRHIPRIQISFDIDVYKAHQLRGCFKTKDVSLGGISLMTDANLFSLNDMIRLRLHLNEPTSLLRAMVTHVSSQVTGLTMIDYSQEIHRIIYALYKERQIPLKRSLPVIESSGMKFQSSPYH